MSLKPALLWMLVCLLQAAGVCSTLADPPATDAHKTGDVRLSGLFASHMVLQRDQPITVWGWAPPGDEVRASGLGEGATTKTNADGRWRMTLPAMPAGGPYRLTVLGRNSISLENIMIGDVWLCAGQSNMQWMLSQASDVQKATATRERSEIRLLQIRRDVAATPLREIQADWTTYTPERSARFSAVACFFGIQLQEKLNVPIGLIDCSWGGTTIETWMPSDSPISAAAIQQVRTAGHPSEPGMIFNGMVSPLTQMPVRGIIWYQGESNVRRAATYGTLFKTMITSWRKAWGVAELPFGFVQIPPFDYSTLSDWKGTPQSLPILREGQAQAERELPNVGMIVAIDLGMPTDVHPPKKHEVARRLALWALATAHMEKNCEYRGPAFKSAGTEGDTMRIFFEHAADGIVSRDGKPLTCFQIAGEDRRFFPAHATIDGASVLVRSDSVRRPAAVRFAYVDIAEPNLFSRAGLPAAPFRTDDWPIETTRNP